MKKYLLPESGQFYKANLHCHSNLSDGKLSPAEMKQIYREKGYSVIAYTDHDIMIPHPELRDADFLPLTGFEAEITEECEWRYARTCHICFIALEESNTVMPFWHREKYYTIGNAAKSAHLVQFREDEPDFERRYDPDCINEMIRLGRERGFFVTYNHPTWSMEDYPVYTKYRGMNAMEMVNYGCQVFGFDDYNPRVYDDMLRTGHRIYCIDTDDNHNREPMGAMHFDSFGGFTMIKAEKLEYTQITDALVKGHFYASEGPLIHSLYYEDGKVFVSTSPVREIYITKPFRNVALRKEPGKLITEACFDVEDDDVYFFITAVGTDGTKAYTNACFLDELLK